MGIYKEVISTNPTDSILEYWEEHEAENLWSPKECVSADAIRLNSEVQSRLDVHNMFLAKNNLEEDLADSCLVPTLNGFYHCRKRDSLVSKMQKRKAENMLAFLKDKSKSLSVLSNDEIATPLKRLVQLVENEVHPHAN